MSKTSQRTSTDNTNSGGFRRAARRVRGALTTAVAATATLTFAGRADAGLGNWWLPANYAKHGVEMDYLFTLVFWITFVVMIGVFAVMIYFLWKYRYNPERKKAHFTHGNTKLEMAWTILPAIILAVIALYSKGVWDRYRHGDPNEQGKPARLLVIGQQFQWNVIYAGPDGKIGKYLVYPKPTDSLWPKDKDGQPVEYEGVKGPADLPYEKAVAAINKYIDSENPLGKVYEDKDGQDDNYENAPGREINLPVDTPLEIQLSSKDVIHDFFLPNFRVKLDAVPGLRGVINFVARPDGQSTQKFPLDKLDPKLPLWIDSSTPGADVKGDPGEYVIYDPTDKRPKRQRRILIQRLNSLNDVARQTLMREGVDPDKITPQQLAPAVEKVRGMLKDAGITEVWALARSYDLVCEELCGQGHYTMQGTVNFVSKDQFQRFIDKKPYEAPAASADHPAALAGK